MLIFNLIIVTCCLLCLINGLKTSNIERTCIMKVAESATQEYNFLIEAKAIVTSLNCIFTTEKVEQFSGGPLCHQINRLLKVITDAQVAGPTEAL